MIYSLTNTLDEDFTTDWYKTDNYSTPFKSASVQLDWSATTGTELNGTVYIEVSSDPDNTDFVTIAGSVAIDSEDSSDDDELVQVNYLGRGIRLRYDAGDITDGELNSLLILED